MTEKAIAIIQKFIFVLILISFPDLLFFPHSRIALTWASSLHIAQSVLVRRAVMKVKPKR